MKRQSIMLLAGEVSGDMHAATLVRAIREKRPEIDFFGVGGDELKKVGMELVYHVNDTAVLGFTDVLLKIRFFRRMLADLLNLARERKPDAILLVDYPGFNLRFAQKARGMGFKVIYYVCPQVWAWRRSRVAKMARAIDHLIAIFPFEKQIFADSGLKVSVASHPLVESAKAALSEPLSDLPWLGGPKIALLPGSRGQEIKRMLPAMWSAAAKIEKMFPESSFIVAAPDENIGRLAARLLERLPGGPSSWSLAVGKTRQVLRQASAALVASGTATIEAALIRCPMVIVYKTAWATYLIGRLLIRVPYLGMVNIVAGKAICPELIQHEAEPCRMASELARLLSDDAARTRMLRDFDGVAAALSGTGAEAADIVMEQLDK